MCRGGRGSCLVVSAIAYNFVYPSLGQHSHPILVTLKKHAWCVSIPTWVMTMATVTMSRVTKGEKGLEKLQPTMSLSKHEKSSAICSSGLLIWQIQKFSWGFNSSKHQSRLTLPSLLLSGFGKFRVGLKFERSFQMLSLIHEPFFRSSAGPSPH